MLGDRQQLNVGEAACHHVGKSADRPAPRRGEASTGLRSAAATVASACHRPQKGSSMEPCIQAA